MKPKLPKYVKAYTDRHGKPRFYYRRKGNGVKDAPLPGLPWSREFMDAYAAAAAAATVPAPRKPIGANRTIPGSVNAGLVAYYQDDCFKKLPESVAKPSRALLERFRQQCGELPLHKMERQHVQKIVSKLASPAAQRNMLYALRRFLKFAQSHNLIDNDPSLGVMRAKMVETGGFVPWTEDDVAKYVARHRIGTLAYLALQIMLCLGLRRSDAVQIGPHHIRKTREHPLGVLNDYLPQKVRRTGGKRVTVPLHPDLAAAIEAMPATGKDTFLTTAYGKPFTAPGFGNKVREWCNEAGLPECSSHGLRKLCAIRLIEAECHVYDVISITGHKDPRELQPYVDAYERKKAAARAVAKLVQSQKVPS